MVLVSLEHAPAALLHVAPLAAGHGPAYCPLGSLRSFNRVERSWALQLSGVTSGSTIRTRVGGRCGVTCGDRMPMVSKLSGLGTNECSRRRASRNSLVGAGSLGGLSLDLDSLARGHDKDGDSFRGPRAVGVDSNASRPCGPATVAAVLEPGVTCGASPSSVYIHE